MDYKKILARMTEKWPAKVLSVVAAIFLFAFHRMGDLQERHFSVPLHLEIDASLIPGSSFPQNIRITLRGDNKIFQVSEADIEAHLDLSKHLEPGLYKGSVQIVRKGNAAETEIMEIAANPEEISLELDTRMSKTVPLSPQFQGYLEPGYEMVSYFLEPNQAVIDGPMKLVTGVSELATDSIELGSRNSDFAVRVQIINPNRLLIIRGDGTAEFKGFIKELILIKSFENIPIQVKGLGGNLEASLDPLSASIKIQGVQSLLDSVAGEADALVLSVDCSGINGTGSFELPLLVTVKDGLSVERREPETVKAVIRQKE